MKHILHILNIEDNRDDSELVHAVLTREGIESALVRVETKEDFIAALDRGGFDLILADYALPSFDGLSALKIAKEISPEVPFIFVSGAIGEEVAIETLKRGATDYVLKERLSRLPGAISRALLEVEEQTKRRQAEKELENYREHLEELVRERTTELNKVNEQLRLELIDRGRLEEKLRTASITDELTGLLNRRGFLTFAQKQLGIARRNMSSFSVLYLDLDEMKKINDEFGHKEGDQALIDISNILKKTLRAADIIARIGGDEFTVLITENQDPAIEQTVTMHIQDNIRIHNEQSEKRYKLSVSMGVVYYDPKQPSSVEELLDRADELMYEHKQHRYLRKEFIPSSRGGIQERTFSRHVIEADLAAELVVSGSVMIKNISISGVSVSTSQRLAKNAIYNIRIRSSNNEELSLKGLVVWSSLLGKVTGKDDSESYYEAGLRFIELNDDLISSIEKFFIDL